MNTPNPTTVEDSRRVALPPFLLQRLEGFRITKADKTTYVIRDKETNRSFAFDDRQFFTLRALAHCDTFYKLELAFIERFGREITQAELDRFLTHLAEQKMFGEAAGQHPQLAPFARGIALDAMAASATRPGASFVSAPAPAPTSAPTPAPTPAPRPARTPPATANPRAAALQDDPQPSATLPAGVQDALGLDRRATKTFIALFDLRRLLDALMPALMPLRHLRHAVPMLAAAALFIVFTQWHVIAEDLRRLELDRSLLAQLIVVFLCVRTVTTLTAAAVARRDKVAVGTVGVAMVFGFVPRWAVKASGARAMSRHQVMWLHGATLLSRLFMFGAGMLAWYSVRDGNSWWSQLGLVLSLACGVSLLLDSGNPLVKANSYHLLAAFLDEPRLRDKAFAAWTHTFKGKANNGKSADRNVLALYGLLSLTYVLLLILFTGWVLSRFLTVDGAPGGAAITIVPVLAGVAGFMIWRTFAGLRTFARTDDRRHQVDRWRSRSLAVEATGVDTPVTRGGHRWKRAQALALALALGLMPSLFLPYTYEPSGSFVVSAARRAGAGNNGAATAQIDIIEGDIQHVKVGATVRARPAAWFNDEFRGKVTLIDSNVTAKSSGNVIRVTAAFDNQDGRLITGMVGLAKIESTVVPVWKAFTQAITRFVRLHVWSWIP